MDGTQEVMCLKIKEKEKEDEIKKSSQTRFGILFYPTNIPSALVSLKPLHTTIHAQRTTKKNNKTTTATTRRVLVASIAMLCVRTD